MSILSVCMLLPGRTADFLSVCCDDIPDAAVQRIIAVKVFIPVSHGCRYKLDQNIYQYPLQLLRAQNAENFLYGIVGRNPVWQFQIFFQSFPLGMHEIYDFCPFVITSQNSKEHNTRYIFYRMPDFGLLAGIGKLPTCSRYSSMNILSIYFISSPLISSSIFKMLSDNCWSLMSFFGMVVLPCSSRCFDLSRAEVYTCISGWGKGDCKTDLLNLYSYFTKTGEFWFMCLFWKKST